VVYRDGGSEGSFESIREVEVDAVLLGLTQTFHAIPGCCSNRESTDGVCKDCRLPLTFVVSQTDHNTCLVPSDGSSGIKNVPSGTVVDASITTHSSMSGSNDFFLTAHGGLKGTSKPMLYRTIVNENDFNGGLQQLTYEMSFQCKFRKTRLGIVFRTVWCHLTLELVLDGSATKAPRKVPVLLNSEKLSSRIMKSAGCKYFVKLIEFDHAGNMLTSLPSSDLGREINLTLDEETEEFVRNDVRILADCHMSTLHSHASVHRKWEWRSQEVISLSCMESWTNVSVVINKITRVLPGRSPFGLILRPRGDRFMLYEKNTAYISIH